MSKKPLIALVVLAILPMAIAQRAPAEAPRVYVCDVSAAIRCGCTAHIVWTPEPTQSYDLCLRVGAEVSADPVANCEDGLGAGDELCGWQFKLLATAGLTVSGFTPNGEENLLPAEPPSGPVTSLSLNWLYVAGTAAPLPASREQRLGTVTLAGSGSEQQALRVSAGSRAVHADGDEVSIDPGILFLMPEPSRGPLLLVGIAMLLALSRRDRRSAYPLLLAPLLLASLAPPARTEPMISPESPSVPMFEGAALAALEDINGDRVADLGIGLPDADGGRGQVVLQLFRRDGTLHGTLLVGQGQGNFGGTLAAGANFGAALASPGDLNGDGFPELAVAAPGTGDIWILFFDQGPPLRVDAQKSKSISLGEAVYSLAALGDLNGDSVPDLAAGRPLDDTGCEPNCGAVSLLFLGANGSLSGPVVTLQNGISGVPTLGQDMRFGSSLAVLGDLDGNGSLELAVGAVGGGGSAKGSVEVLSLDTTGAVLSNAVIDKDSEGFALFSDVEIGRALVALGDLDASGGSELAVSTAGPDGTGEGRVALLVLGTAPGSVVASASLDATSPWATGASAVGSGTSFGRALATLDIDADGDPELAVGAASGPVPHPSDPVWMLALGDTDDDQRPNFVDNCELVPNPLQDDEDGDGVGDICDVCPHVADPGQLDEDMDGTGDACEPTIVRLRPDSVDDTTIQRTDWTLELECGSSNVTEVVVALTPRDANPADFDFGIGCGEPELTCGGCPVLPTACVTAVDLGGTVDRNSSGVLVTDGSGEYPPFGLTNLRSNTLYAVLRGDPALNDRLCNAGDPNPAFLGRLHLNVSPPAGVNPQVTPSVAQLAGVGPIRDVATVPDRYRIECDRCAYELDPGARAFTKSQGSGDDYVDYELTPVASTIDPHAVTEWELCFKAPEKLHRIALSVLPIPGISMHWQGCGSGMTGVVEFCEPYLSDSESPYGPIYNTVDVDDATAATSLSYLSSTDGEFYLLLDGSLPSQHSTTLSAVPHNSQYPEPEMTCVARLETVPAIDPDGPQGIPVVRALAEAAGSSELPAAVQSELAYCTTNPVLIYLTEIISPPIAICQHPEGQHSTFSDNQVPEDNDGDERRVEEDNCPYFPNTTQLDRGGNGLAIGGDGNGDKCQCGDADAVDGAVLLEDVEDLRNHLANPNPAVEPRCSVGGSSACTIHDAVLLQRATSSDPFEGEFAGKCAADLP